MRWFLGVFVFYFLLILSFTARAGDAPALVPTLQFDWYIPSMRQNGSNLPLADIGGYELRYRVKGSGNFKSIVIRGASYKSYSIRGLPLATYEAQIATFDADGLYSLFVPITYKLVR